MTNLVEGMPDGKVVHSIIENPDDTGTWGIELSWADGRKAKTAFMPTIQQAYGEAEELLGEGEFL